jgi:hypothetical protein
MILAMAGINEEEFDQCIETLKIWGSRPDAAFWFAMC